MRPVDEGFSNFSIEKGGLQLHHQHHPGMRTWEANQHQHLQTERRGQFIIVTSPEYIIKTPKGSVNKLLYIKKLPSGKIYHLESFFH